MELNIYNKEGKLKVTVSPADSSTLTEGLMTDSILSLSFVHFGCIALDVNDYIDFLGKRYWMLEAYIPNQKSTIEWNYSTKFYGIESVIRRALCLKTVDKEMNAVFSLTAPAIEHVRLVVGNINRVMGTTDWKTGEVEATANLTVDYNATYCDAALSSIASAADTEWWIDGLTVNLCRCEHGELLSLGYENGLKEITLDTNENAKFFTRLFPLGSTRNIDPAKYGSARLQLPGGAKYVEQNTHYGVIEHSEEAAFSAIYPQRVGKVGVVRHETKKGEDGKNFDIYYFTDPDIDFNPNEYEIGGLVKNIVFETGDLAGRDFEVNYNADKKEFEVVTQWPYGDDMQLPGALVMKTGNDYILYNITMPAAYYPKAEQEFSKAVAAYMEKNKRDKSVYKAPTDYIDLSARGLLLTIGQRIHLVSDKYFPSVGYRDSRITRISRKVNEVYQADIEISDLANPGGKVALEQGIKQAKNYAQAAMAGLPDMVKSWENTPPSDSNLYTAKKTNKEIRDKAVSRQYDDSMDGHLTCKNGLTVQSPLTARQLKSVMSDALGEDGDGNGDMLSISLAEEGDGNTEVMSTALEEVAIDGGFGGGTIGELDNVDPSFDTLKPGKYGIEVKVDGIIRPIPATSLGVGSRLTLTAKSEPSMIALTGDAIVLKYEFSSVDTSDESPTGAGTAYYTVNGVRIATMPIAQGIVSWDCTKYLTAGDNSITVSVTDAYSVNRILTFTVQVVTLSISSTFDEYQAYTGDIQFRYTPIGAIQKNIIFKVDNKVIATVPTTSNNRQMTQVIPAQTHGAHILEVHTEAQVGDRTVKSNVLRYALACYVPGNNAVVIASAFNESTAEQYSTVSVPYFVYNPAASTASVTLKANGVTVSERVVDRTRQLWNYRADKAGSLTLNVAVGSVSKSFALNVTESDIDVSAETEHLQLYLTASGRSNNEANPGNWSNNGVSAALTGFNFVTNGWIPDAKGIVSLKVSGDARVAIPLKIFGSDFRLTGKTIEFEISTTDVVDYNAVVISCMNGGRGIEMTSQSASLRSEQSAINTRFKEDERVRVAFVIEERTGSRLIYTYIDGIASGVVQYPTDDNFMQAKPADIIIGSNDCTVCIHNIRVYDAALNSFQMLDNCIADMDDMQTKIAMYARNQVFDNYGDVSYTKVLEQLPGLTIIGDLPTYKGDKKTVIMIYEDRQNPSRSWRAENVQIDVQGTSSQYYPRKNFKVKCRNGFIMTATGEVVAKFAIREGEIPVNIFCFKADFAESSGTHNTGMAKVIDRVLRAMNYLVPPQKLDARVRTTVDGYPFTIFHRATEASALEFVGKYNFNNDKSTQETFGFAGAMECWEIKNNTSDRVLFIKSDYATKDAEGTPDWLNDFEARYPDNDDLNAEYEAGKIPVNLKRLTDWLVSTKDNPTKFKAEASQYLDLNFILSYYSITELFAMVDQRAKNMFLTTYDGVHWAVIFYDNDTCLGVNNEGAVAFGYDVEYHDTEGSGQVWNGEQSVLWNNVEAAYLPEITTMYQLMRSSGAISYDMCIGVLNGEQSDKWCEAIYNADGKFKYIDPLLNEGNGSYLYAMQGSRAQHRKWWLYNRFRYIDSKYVAGDFKSDYVTMRLYTPNTWQGVKPNADFTLTPAGDVYVSVKYGSYIISKRGHKGVPVTIKAPEIAFNDTETIVYGAAYIGSLGNLSAMYPGTVDISKATKLTELIVGSGAVGYQNSNLTVLAIGNNTLFRRLNVMNCPRLTQPIDVSGCENIEEIYAQGTSITSVKLPNAGRLSQLYLPDTITSLTIRNQTLTQDGFELADIKNLSTVYIENTNGIDSATLINRCLASSTPVLQRVRLIGMDWRLNSLDTLVKLAKLKGLDVNGMNADKAVITGKCHVLLATSVKLAEVKAAFPELVITYTQLKPETVTTFVFGSSQSKTITNSSLVCNFDAVKVNETTYKITAQDNETISFTFKCDNHVDYSNTYLVAGTRTQNYSVTYIPLRTIRVKVYNQSVYLQGATVIANGKRYTSDANGYVTLVRGGEAASGEVSAFGYAGNTFSFGAITSDTTNTVEVYAAVEVKFIVKYGSKLIEGATVKSGSESGTTNLYGECVLMLGKGTQEYTVSHPNYFDCSGTVNVGTSSLTTNVALKINIESMKPVENGNIQMLLQGTSASISVTSSIANYVIDWGDGSSSSATGTGNVSYTHTYVDDAFYQVDVRNHNGVAFCIGSTSCLIAYWSLGSSQVKNLSFASFSELMFLGNVFKNDINRTSAVELLISCISLTNVDLTPLASWVNVTNCDSLLYGCRSLTSVDLTPLTSWVNVTNCSRLLQSCSSLTSVDLTPLASWVEVTNCDSLLYGCSSLTSVDLTPLTSWANVTNCSRLLQSCSSLTSVDLTPLASWVNVTNCSRLLQSCSSLTSVDLIPLSSWVKVADCTYLLTGCRSLTSINLTPLASWVEVTSCFSLLDSCFSLTSIDLTPLASWVKVTNCSSLLYGCRSLTSVDLTPLDSWVNVTSCSSLLYDCSGLTSVDLTPLASWVNVTGCGSLLQNCSSLTSVDLTPLASWVKVTNCYNLLIGCRSLTSIDLTPLASWVKVTNCSKLLQSCSSLTSVDLTPLASWVNVTNCDSLLVVCSNLAYISILSVTPFTLSSGALTNGNSCPIYVPDSAVDIYKTATNWSYYASRIQSILNKP